MKNVWKYTEDGEEEFSGNDEEIATKVRKLSSAQVDNALKYITKAKDRKSLVERSTKVLSIHTSIVVSLIVFMVKNELIKPKEASIFLSAAAKSIDNIYKLENIEVKEDVDKAYR